jgi:MFS family permease
MFGISNVVGPILGGAFTQHLSWRWCFYINLPLGAITAFIMILFFRPHGSPMTTLPLAQKAKHLDLLGLLLFIPAVVMLLLALQWGGNAHAWKSATVIGLIVGFTLLITLFGLWQWHQNEEASIPLRVLGQRNVYSAAAMVFFGLGSASYAPLFLMPPSLYL